MRLIGLQYLHKTLRPTLELICNERKPCEIDPTRVRDANTIAANLTNLKLYIQKIFDAITQSAVHCPTLMCQIFHNLKECALQHFPENKGVRYSVISGFIFLRFFAPAILGPKLFDLTTQPIVSDSSRWDRPIFTYFFLLLGLPDQQDADSDLEDDPVPGQPGELSLRPAGVQGGVHGVPVQGVLHGEPHDSDEAVSGDHFCQYF